MKMKMNVMKSSKKMPFKKTTVLFHIVSILPTVPKYLIDPTLKYINIYNKNLKNQS
jgi:hypothetical protein